jgi:hypothetical protein
MAATILSADPPIELLHIRAGGDSSDRLAVADPARIIPNSHGGWASRCRAGSSSPMTRAISTSGSRPKPETGADPPERQRLARPGGVEAARGAPIMRRRVQTSAGKPTPRCA